MEHPNRNRILGVLFVGVLMGALDIAIVGPALPALQATFDISERALSWILSIYVLFSLVGTPLMAKLSDRVGRRTVYIADVLLFAAGSLIVALSPTFAVLLLGRAIQGLGAGGIFPVASAVIADTFPADRRGRALGLIGAVFGLAFIIGPILGGLLLRISWHLLFYTNLPVAIGVVIAASRIIPTTHPPEHKPFDWAGLALSIVILGSLSLGLNQLGGSELSILPWVLIFIGMGLLSIFGAVENRAADPIFRFRMLGSRQMLLANALAFGAGMGMMAVSFLPTLITAAFGVSPSSASFMLLPLIIAMMIGSPLSGRLLDSIGSRTVVLGGTILLLLGLLLLALLPITLVSYYSATIVMGAGLSALLGAPVRYIVLNAAPVVERTTAQGAISVVGGIGQLLSAALIGSIAASAGGGVAGFQSSYFVMGVVTVGMVVAAYRLKNRSAELEAMNRNEGNGESQGHANIS
jgi:EmrB/QacA subfamily drug resistance transporter